MRFTRLTAASPLPSTGGTVHAYLIHGAVPTLIDAPSDAPDFIAQVEAALAAAGDGPLQQLLATHAHPDHVAGASALAARFPDCRRLKRPWPGRDESSGVTWEAISGEPMLPAGDSRLWVIETPGHAPDHLAFFDITDGVMFAGDLVINGGTVTIPPSHGGSLNQYLQSLRKVLDLQPRRMLPSHGSDVDQPSSLLRGYISHRMLRERQVLEVLAAADGTTADAIVDRLYASVAAALKPAARENVMAHLIKLEQEGRVHAAGDTWHLTGR